MFKRVILKISGEGLSGDNKNEHFHDDTINRIVSEVNTLVEKGVEVCIVVGGGNFWRGRDAKSQMDKVKAHQIGMTATIMNGIYLAEAFRINDEINSKINQTKQKAVVMTPFDVNGFTIKYTKELALEYMSKGIVPIFAGGTGHPFFSTDSIVAIRACELCVDAVLYGKNVECVYDDDPRKNKNARKLKTVPYDTVIANNLEVADISAITLTSKEDISSIVFALSTPKSIITACEDNDSLFEIGGTKIDNNIKTEYY